MHLEQGGLPRDAPVLTPCSAQLDNLKRVLRNTSQDVRRRAVAAVAEVAAEYASDGESTQGPPSQDGSVERQATTDSLDLSTRKWSNVTASSDYLLPDDVAATCPNGDLGLCRGRKQRCPRGYRAEKGCDGLCWLCKHDRPGWWSYEDERMLQERSANSGLSKLPSLGSALHPGRCRPCGFFHGKAGCGHGDQCFHCHACEPTEFKARRKEKVTKLRDGLREEAATAQQAANGYVQQPSIQPIVQHVVPAFVFLMPYGYSQCLSQTC